MSYVRWSILLLIFHVSIGSNSVRGQMMIPTCSFQEVDLVPCLNGNRTLECCTALNKALLAGHGCACNLMASAGIFLATAGVSVASTNPLAVMSAQAPPLQLVLPGCFISAPSLTSCQGTYQIPSSPTVGELPATTSTISPPAVTSQAVNSTAVAAPTVVSPAIIPKFTAAAAVAAPAVNAVKMNASSNTTSSSPTSGQSEKPEQMTNGKKSSNNSNDLRPLVNFANDNWSSSRSRKEMRNSFLMVLPPLVAWLYTCIRCSFFKISLACIN